MKPPRFVLGTANLGSKYGINNSEEFSLEVSRNVLSLGIRRGINIFDTAAEYGVAEELIGATINSTASAQIITKIPTRASYSYEFVSQCLEQSLNRLKQNRIYGLMFHDPDIHKKREIQDISKMLLDSGKVEHLGFSAYTLEALLDAKKRNPIWNIFQVPENIMDQRLVNSIEMIEMARLGNIFFVRSVFLQGLLLSLPSELPEKFKSHKKIFLELHKLADRLGVKPIDLCVSYSLNIPWSSGVIIAAASTSQLNEILDFKFVKTDFNLLDKLPEQVLDPRCWSEFH
jgi:aryl-alcohol dehydrogenase-like predicted oxidoreductase